ncbi:MAG: type II toxin-antitoxin system VapC family toxin [Acidobacteriota bacterium]|nr:type II toxin-antitoxin system VapC family toxin [Acidobacteriota bacterium]
MKSKVYIETSIPSFYHEVRPEPEMVARRQWTRQWWAQANDEYSLVTSVPVLGELNRGRFPNKEQVIELIADVPLLPLEPAILEIGETYITHKLMPADPGGDALHLAIASYHKCDFLLTWNCRHLANANKFGHIRRINTLLGLFVPQLVTPLELIGGSYGS